MLGAAASPALNQFQCSCIDGNVLCRDMGVNVTYPYQFGSGTTRKVLLIRRGNSDRVCPMYVVSNTKLEAQDLSSLTAYNEDQRMPQITRSHTNRKKEDLEQAQKYVLETSTLSSTCA